VSRAFDNHPNSMDLRRLAAEVNKKKPAKRRKVAKKKPKQAVLVRGNLKDGIEALIGPFDSAEDAYLSQFYDIGGRVMLLEDPEQYAEDEYRGIIYSDEDDE